MRTVLVCVRTPVAARAVSACADRLGVAAAVRTAVSGVEVMARLAERPADVVLVDTAVIRPDPVGFVRRATRFAPDAAIVLFGPENSQVAAAAVVAGARGVIRSRDQDVVTSVAKTLLLLAMPIWAQPPGGPVPGAVAPSGPAAGHPTTPAGTAASAVAASAPAVPAMRATLSREQLVPAQRADLSREPGEARRPLLTERELQVLRGMADGKSNAEIGRELYVSEDTVKTHARRLFRKLGARDRAHAVAAGFRAGLVS
ncbi:MAG TPA: response regulator transcription factor [Rugosimonospora sp.]|nr:response regulator transcription factor [Rugosimonospora sp.]